MEWSSERIDQLRSLWHNGMSASQIATQLGGISRNAVIGKAHRLGLVGRPSPIKNRPAGVARRTAPRRPRVEPAQSAPRAVAAPVTVTPPSMVNKAEPSTPRPEISDAPGATILTLTDRICKWPIGDPRDADFHFCGRASAESLPYCADHAKRAYQPPARRSNEREDHAPRMTLRR
jgi:GcrA cell cycle regulator